MKRFSVLFVIVLVFMTGCIIVPAGGHRGHHDYHYDHGHYDGWHDGGHYRR